MILLVGGCGFLGKSLADHLHAQGHALKIFDRPEAIDRRRVEAPGFLYCPGDFNSIAEEDALFEGVTSVVHLVHSTIPATSMEDAVFDAESNILPSIRLLDAVQRHGIRRFLFVSSGGTVYGVPQRLPVSEDDPTTPLCAYGVSKLAIEKYVQLYEHIHGLDGIVVRLANPYGSYQLGGAPVGAIANFMLRTLRGIPIEIWGDGSTIRDYIYIDDVVEAIEALLVRPAASAGVYNLGSGIGRSLQDVVDVIRRVSGHEPAVEYYPSRKIDVPAIVLDVSRLDRRLGWKPRVSMQEGVSRLWQELACR